MYTHWRSSRDKAGSDWKFKKMGTGISQGKWDRFRLRRGQNPIGTTEQHRKRLAVIDVGMQELRI